MSRLVAQVVLILSGIRVAALAFDNERVGPYAAVPAHRGEYCAVCGGALTEKDVALIVKGRRVPLDSMDIAEFLKNQEKYFASLQPRGALFAESPEAAEGTALGGIPSGWFAFGVYVLLALLFGGLSGYAAVGKGLAPLPHFFIGFAFSIAGYLYVLSRPSRARPGEVPEGLVKVPVTAAPTRCKVCGMTNHPSASRCIGCGVQLSPTIQSEVKRAL